MTRTAQARRIGARVTTALAGLSLVLAGSTTPAVAADEGMIAGTIVLPAGVQLPPDDVLTLEAHYEDYTLATTEVHPDDLSFGLGGIWQDDVQILLTESSGAVADGWVTARSTSWDRADALDVPVGSDLTVHLDEAVAIEGKVAVPAGVRAQRTAVRVSAYGPRRGAGSEAQRATVTAAADGLSYRIDGLRRGEQYELELWDPSWLLTTGWVVDPGGALVDDESSGSAIAAPGTVDIAPEAAPVLAGTLRLPPGAVADAREVEVIAHKAGSDRVSGAHVDLDPLVPDALAFTIPNLDPEAGYTLSVVDHRSSFATAYVGTQGWTAGAVGARPIVPSSVWLDLRLAEPAAFTGRVVYPTGFDPTRHNPPTVSAYADGEEVATGYAATDGTFELDGLLPGGGYDVRLADSSKQLVAGHVAADGTVVAGTSPVALLEPGPLTVRAALTGRVSVAVSVADGRAPGVKIRAFDDEGQGGEAYVAGSGTAVVPGLQAGRDYHVQISATGYGDGWYAGENRPPSGSPGAAVRAGDSISVVLEPEFSIVPTFTFPAGYCSQSLENTFVHLSRLSTEGWSFQLGMDVDSWMPATFEGLRPRQTYALSISSSDEDVEQEGYVAPDGRVGVPADEAARFTRDARITIPIHLSADSPHVLRSTRAPVLSGTPRVGVAMSASRATWSREGVTTAWQWFRGSAAISGATRSSYVPTAADLGARLTARATGTTAECSAVRAMSAPTVPVAAGVVTSTRRPVVSGIAKVGARLSATAGSWSVPGLTYRYQWLRGATAIHGATGSSYVPSAADRGAHLAVRVTASRAGYTSAGATSAATSAVRSGTITSVKRPSVSGTAKVGRKLTAKVGSWSPGGLTYRYQWYRNGSAIHGATHAVRTVTTKDRGKKLTVRVTALRAGYTSVSATSRPTSAVRR